MIAIWHYTKLEKPDPFQNANLQMRACSRIKAWISLLPVTLLTSAVSSVIDGDGDSTCFTAALLHFILIVIYFAFFRCSISYPTQLPYTSLFQNPNVENRNWDEISSMLNMWFSLWNCCVVSTMYCILRAKICSIISN